MNRFLTSGGKWTAGWLLLATWAAPLYAVESQWVRTGASGRLVYTRDADGDRIPDFSMVGFAEGKRESPTGIPVVATVSPLGGMPGMELDDTAQLQTAINAVAAMPQQANGFRGAIQLGPGKFYIDTRLNITASGIVLRGSGSGDDTATSTHIISRNRADNIATSASSPVISIQGSSTGITRGPQINIIDKRVPVGAQSFRVASTAGFTVGGMVEIFRPSTQAWIEALGMHLIPDGKAWSAGDQELHWQRTITRIEGNRVFLDAPITTALDVQYGGGTIRTYNAPNVIRNIGIENLRGQSLDLHEETNEARTPTFVRFSRVEDGWVKDVQTRHFSYASVYTLQTDGTQHITVDNVTSLLPSGVVTGGRRYTFAMDGQMSLVKNSHGDSGRHDYVTGSAVTGPIVFYNSTTANTRGDTGPHHRWGNGLLFDNIDVNGNAINVQNRWTSGSGHGWAGANVVVWNSEANSFIAQSPPTAQSWLIGSTGTINAGDCHLAGATCAAYNDSHGTAVTAGGETSLYEAQLNDAADIRTFHWKGGAGNWNDHLKWNQEVKPGVYAVQMRDYLYGDIDSHTFDPGVESDDLPYTDPAWQAAVFEASRNLLVGFDTLAPNRSVTFTMQHQLSAGERVLHGSLAMSFKQGGEEVATDFIQLFDMQSQHRLNLSTLGWASQINATTPFAGTLDMSQFLDKLQSGSVNVWVSDDVAVDWASYTVAVAKPIADAVGPTVFLDGGNVTVDAVVGPAGDVQNGGPAASRLTIARNGRLNVIDDFTQAADSTLVFQLGRDTAGQFGTLAVGDAATLSGTLKIELVGGFIPSAGDNFAVLTAANLATPGGLAAMLPTLPGDLTWQLAIGSNGVTANVLGTILVGDLNGNQQINSTDWALFKAGQGTNFSGLSKMQAYLKGDLDGDLDHDLADFFAFRVAYENAHGSGSFASLLAGVPEPRGLVPLSIAAGLVAMSRARARERAPVFQLPRHD
jgi:hypothetical protein